jgi:hypothetical protein
MANLKIIKKFFAQRKKFLKLQHKNSQSIYGPAIFLDYVLHAKFYIWA